MLLRSALVYSNEPEKSMDDLVASKTAVATSRMRALHTRRTEAPIFQDPWGDQLVPASLLRPLVQKMSATLGVDAEQFTDAEVEALSDEFLLTSPSYTNVITRSRYTEDALHAALAEGVRQYVLIGAGFDSYGLRRPEPVEDLVIIEVDHPATQSLKLQQIANCDGTVDDAVHFIAADLSREPLGKVLSRSAFVSSQPAFLSWLGVTMYLTREANMATLSSIADNCAAGSQLVFSYIDQKLFDAPTDTEKEKFKGLEESVKAMGEPFVSGFDPAALGKELAALGLELLEDWTEGELVTRYDATGISGLISSDRSHVALVGVVGDLRALS
ncbi:MAG: methyltransferase (TIGR00027 family) [Halioglobus sp.]|jgi:methyltransferase (TIGR00027 family)